MPDTAGYAAQVDERGGKSIMLSAPLELLAAVPQAGWYLHPAKIVVMLALFAVWLLLCQWIDKDTRLVNAQQLLWNGIVSATGVTGLILWLLIPFFGVGLAVFLLVAGGGVGAYIVHRNSLVVDQAKVCTISHFKRLAARGRGPASEQVEELVRLTDYDGRQVQIPDDVMQRQQYRLTQELLHDALWRRASDVDMYISGQQARIAYRIDGVVSQREPMPAASAEMVLGYLKKLAGLDPQERRRPQSGHITAARGGGMKELDKMVKIEVRTSGSTAGERLMMRVLAEETRFKISDLGMSDQQLRQFQAVVDRPRGLVLCCGPRQSGLTSTLYAILRSHDAFMKNIHTLELRPSLELENITQNIHDPHDSEVSFARRVQTILRADPDVVMIAAVADAETARLINQAAMERAKLYVGLNTSDCFEALQSWLSLVDDPRLVARALLAITAQRLVRRLCPECKQPYRPDPQTLRKANLPADRIQQFYRRGGYVLNKKGERLVCQTCQGSGYFGRTAIFELLVVDETVRKLIVSRASISQIKAACRKTRPPMLYLQEQGLRRVMEGVTSINEIIRVTRSEPSRAPTGAG